MSIVSNNIKYLRRLNGLTQEQFARKIAIKRSLLGAYEEARANPNLTNLKNMAAAFGISVDNLLKNDLRKLRETPDLSLPLSASRQMTVSHSGQTPAAPPVQRVPAMSEPQPLSKIIDKFQAIPPEIRTVSRQVNLKPVNGGTYQPAEHPRTATPQPVPQVPADSRRPAASPSAESHQMNQLPVFNNQYTAHEQVPAKEKEQEYPVIQWVARKYQSEYLANYQNPAYLTQLPAFQLPNLPAGYYRAFESGEDFPLPGSLLVGTFVRNWFDIRDGIQYIFVLRHHGFVFRRAYNQVKERGILLLSSENPAIAPSEIPLHEVLEVWDIKAFVSMQLPAPQPSLGRISELLDEMQKEIGQLY
ncbi:hypothetical protein DYBT9275_01965 [Dyadobacter sp. CECT 9275]|uniref:HTH cro/C1-type domain-containing protein n=1 Tax=Dyadobacter helix TaxID=2822344 RepID=A0A916JAE8_9BACT|nr:helix-turn-helix transcriptional regulator [Dyadobacter sp. CECT 9275]CAG4998264.1 hypothetical protein DYBT9275_01965 [Dyadobacter sp. CECT 9275]